MSGRRFSSRRNGVGSGRRAYSYGTVVLAVSAAILLFLYLTGRLSF
jgi:hypothetical protein